MLADIGRIYKQSLKPADSYFNVYVARPPAAVFVAALARTRTTPNQVSFFALGIMVAACAALAAIPGPLGLWLGVGGVELSYVFDCVDGQLARITKRTSAVGALLDFLMDELKAFLLIAGIGLRWWQHDGGGDWALVVALASSTIVGAALSLTKFIRTPEYAQATGTAQLKHGEAAGAARTGRRTLLWPFETAARLVSQYPTTLPVFAAFGRLDVFLYAYAAVHLLYLGRTGLVVLLRLGRFAPRTPPAA